MGEKKIEDNAPCIHCDFDDLNPKKMDKDKFVELREKILQQGSTYASENWNVHEKPNEHDNAHDDFIAGALWAIKNHSVSHHVSGSSSPEAILIIENLMAYGRIHTVKGVRYVEGSHEEMLDKAENWLNRVRKNYR